MFEESPGQDQCKLAIISEFTIPGEVWESAEEDLGPLSQHGHSSRVHAEASTTTTFANISFLKQLCSQGFCFPERENCTDLRPARRTSSSARPYGAGTILFFPHFFYVHLRVLCSSASGIDCKRRQNDTCFTLCGRSILPVLAGRGGCWEQKPAEIC
jgi:hypothetical protein